MWEEAVVIDWFWVSVTLYLLGIPVAFALRQSGYGAGAAFLGSLLWPVIPVVIVLAVLWNWDRLEREAEILALLLKRGRMGGLDLVNQSLSGKIRRGTVYVHLSRLVEQGNVYRHEDGTYSITDKARRDFRVSASKGA